MRDLGNLWHRCHDGSIPVGEWQYERKVTIQGSDPYYDDRIKNLKFDRGLLYNELNLGQCIASKLSMSILPREGQAINYRDKITLEIRIKTLNDGETEWFEFGHYYVDKAEEEFERWRIEALDAMVKLDVDFIGSRQGGLTWPASCVNVVNTITNFLGVELDNRSNLDGSIRCTDVDNMTMREALGHIGSLHGGNWYITEEEKLRLVVPVNVESAPISSVVDKSNSKRIVKETTITIDKLIMQYGKNEGESYVVGDGESELEIKNPWATESTAQRVFNVLSNLVYRPHKVSSTVVNPATELGDVITIDGERTHLWQVEYPLRMFANIDIPGDKSSKKQYGQLLIFEGGGTNQEYEDRLDIIEDIIGIGECKLLTAEDFDEKKRYNGPGGCVMLPMRFSDDIPSQVSFRDNDSVVEGLRIVGGFKNLDLTSTFFGSMYSTIDIGDLSRNLDYVDFSYAGARKIIMGPIKATAIFNGCYNLVELDTINLDTSNVITMSNMFDSCESLVTLDVSRFNTSKVESMSFMFSGCESLVELDVSNFDTSNVTNMASMFSSLSMSSLDLSNFDTSRVVNMSNMFRWSNFDTLNISNFTTPQVVDMSRMFQYCYSLKYVDVSNFDTSNVTSMDSMFDECKSLTSLDVSNFDTSKVENMRFIFNDCKSLVELDVSNFDTSNVTSMDSMFSECRSLTSLDVSNFDTSNVTNMSEMFNNCKGLRYIDISNFDTSNVTSIGRMFGGIEASEIDISSLDLRALEGAGPLFGSPLYGGSLPNVYNRDNKLTITFRSQEDVDHFKDRHILPTQQDYVIYKIKGQS